VHVPQVPCGARLRLDVERNVGGDKNEASTANVNRLCCALDYIASVVAGGGWCFPPLAPHLVRVSGRVGNLLPSVGQQDAGRRLEP